MEWVFFGLTAVALAVGTVLALVGYNARLRGKGEPLWVKRGIFGCFCGFFLCWFLWNLMRILF